MTHTPETELAALPFEAALKQLEQLIHTLEQGELPLEQALQQYEVGMRLSQHCKQLLDHAELRIQTLSQSQTPSA